MSPVRPRSANRHRVLFLDDVGFQYGAGLAQARQMQSLLGLGWEVGALAWEPGGIELEKLLTRPIDPDGWLGMRRVRHIERGAPMSDDEITAGLLLEVARFDPTVVIAGNLHAASWPLQILREIKELGYRVVAYMHDGYLFSGRCAYPGPCRLYLTGCNESCPTATEYPPLPLDQINDQWRLRRELFGGVDGIEVAANSRWTAETFREAIPQYHSCETVYLGADRETFCPSDPLLARESLGLPVDRPLILCGAVNFHDKRKGGRFLKEIIERLKHRANFAGFGHNTDSVPALLGLGYHVEQGKVARYYQAANIFIGTAQQEAFGQTVMEAQLSGLPAVLFNVGGVPEIVTDGVNGRLVPVGDVEGMISAIENLLDNPSQAKCMGQAARQNAVENFSLEAQAKRWVTYLSRGVNADQAATKEIPKPPELIYSLDEKDSIACTGRHLPSWDLGSPFISNEHSAIFEMTRHLPGWQTPGDSFKLYEMGYHAGDVIMEIGTFGGRSATVELRGALANPGRTLAPQFYGIDIAPDSIIRTRQNLADQELIEYCHLFEGSLGAFIKQWSIAPTMVFLDGDHRYKGVAADLATLTRYLKRNTPVLVHDYLNDQNGSPELGVRRAADEWSAARNAMFIGCFGCSALYLTLTGEQAK